MGHNRLGEPIYTGANLHLGSPVLVPKPPRPILVLVAAASENNVIGLDGSLPWSLPRDLAHFKRITLGHSVIMGRKTFDEIGKPLPGRLNIVITRQPDWASPGVETAQTLEGAIELAELASPGDTHMVIGGGQIYRLALPLAHRIELTRVHTRAQGDTTFPDLDERWRLIDRIDHEPDESNAHALSFLSYLKQD